MNAAAGSVPVRSSAPWRDRSTAPITVTPSRPATSREAFSRAEATPDRSGGMAPRIALVSGMFISPPPAPKTRKPGIMPANVAC
jgi:hypothetical protein